MDESGVLMVFPRQAEDDETSRLLGLFQQQIRWMNHTFELEVSEQPVDLKLDRLLRAYKSIVDEAREILDASYKPRLKETLTGRPGEALADPFLQTADLNMLYATESGSRVNLTSLADTLGDLVVYAFSEATRWGIPLPEVLQIIMQSQASKLVDGKPIKSADGAKFEKGPNFQPPEPAIAKLLTQRMAKPELQPHQLRVVEEKAELDARMERLVAFFRTEVFALLPADEQVRLNRQFNLMSELSSVLAQRIQAFNSKGE